MRCPDNPKPGGMFIQFSDWGHLLKPYKVVVAYDVEQSGFVTKQGYAVLWDEVVPATEIFRMFYD